MMAGVASVYTILLGELAAVVLVVSAVSPQRKRVFGWGTRAGIITSF